MEDYFSDRENGPKPRVEVELTPAVWAGLAAVVQNLINTGALGYRFPERCPDGQIICGCNEVALGAAITAEILGLTWPLATTIPSANAPWASRDPYCPPTLMALDLLEFVFRSIGHPVEISYHSYRHHHHLRFDVVEGHRRFAADINRILARNGLAFDLTPDGRVVRIPPSPLAAALRRPQFKTGDATLDTMLEESRTKFLDPDPKIRREGLERLWDGWERLKSTAHVDKKRSIGAILDRAASEATFRNLLEQEARALTDAGNNLQIRHYEVSQTPIVDSDHVDYLYHRLFALIELLLRKNHRGPTDRSTAAR